MQEQAKNPYQEPHHKDVQAENDLAIHNSI